MRTKDPETNSFTLSPFIKHVFQQIIQNHSEAISYHIFDDILMPVTVAGEPQAIEHILQHIITNTLEHVNVSKITISIKQLLQVNNQTLIELIIKDNGTKLKPTHINYAYTYKRNLVKGTKLVEAFGGKAEVFTQQDAGTTFTLILKFDTKQATTEKESLMWQWTNLKGKSVLIAEDNEVNQLVLKQIMQAEGVEADIFSNGKEALQHFDKKHYDLLVLDLAMPFMDGFQTARYIRKRLLSTVPMLALTTCATDQEQKDCAQLGFNQYLSKSVSAEVLLTHMQYLITNSKKAHKKPMLKESLYC